MTNYALPALQGSDLSKYISEVSKFPLLEEKEEYNLAMKFKETGNVKAAHRMVTSHLRLVVKIAMGFRGYGLPITDVISEGNVGLMKAVQKFEPEKGFRLSTYAMWWIKASINEFVLKSWSIVKVGTSASQKKLFFNLKSLKAKILKNSNNQYLSDAEIQNIANDLDVSVKDVKDMNALMSSSDQSLNVSVFEDSGAKRLDYIEDGSSNQEDDYADAEEMSINSAILAEAMVVLNDREKDILFKRKLSEKPLTLEDLSQEYGISRERVRQIENRAFEKIQEKILGKRLAS